MTTSATGSVVDTNGAGLAGLAVVLENASSLKEHEVLARQSTGADGKFTLSYVSDFGTGEPGKPVRQLRLRIMLGQLPLNEIARADLPAQSQITFDPVILARPEAESRWATLGSGAPSRMTQGNAVRWLADNEEGWGRVAEVVTHASTLDVMQLDIQTNPFHADPTADTPNIVLRFDASSPYDNRSPRLMDSADDRVERRLLEASMRGCVVRVQIPHWQVDLRAVLLIGVALIIVLSVILVPISLLAAAITVGSLAAVISAAVAWGNHHLARTFKAPELGKWFADAGADGRNVRVRELKLRSIFVTHAKMVVDRDKEALVLGSPFDQDYYDAFTHLIDEPRRGAEPAKGPIHDVSVGVRGPAVADLQALYDELWNLADPTDLLTPPASLPAVTTVLDAGEILTPAQVVRTLDSQFATATNGEKGVLEAYLRGIYFAERFIYIENQYFNNDTITQALIDALQAKPNLRLILLVNVSPDMPLYPGWQQSAIRRIVESAGSSAATRVGVFTKWSHAAATADHPRPRLLDNYLHTKSALIDNRWATVGSANLDGASLDFVQYARALLDGDLRNTESNIVVYEETPATPSPADALRRRLWSEHLGLSGPADSALDDTPTTDWLQLWTQKAQEKLAGLVASPGTVSKVQVLPWPRAAFKKTYQEHVASESYLRTLFDQDGQNSAALVSQFDLVPAGPPPFPFKYKP